jgi:hypothetical protein
MSDAAVIQQAATDPAPCRADAAQAAWRAALHGAAEAVASQPITQPIAQPPADEAALPELVVFGDSHSVIWEGNDVAARAPQPLFPGVRVHHLGPALAWNLMGAAGTAPGKWGLPILAEMARRRDAGTATAAVMLCFGEIDVRTQVVLRALRSGIDLAAAAQPVAQRLLDFAARLAREHRVPVLIWEPVPTSGDSAFLFNPAFPATGSELERNVATACLAAQLREGTARLRAQGLPVHAFGAFEALTLGLRTRSECFADGCHLNLLGLQHGIEALRRLDARTGLSLAGRFRPRSPLAPQPALRDLAPRARLTLSSEHAGPSLLHSPAGRGWCFHTARQPWPHARIDLGYAAPLHALVLHNRSDGHAERARTLHVSTGNAPDALTLRHRCTGPWGEDGSPLVLDLRPLTEPVRFVVLHLTEEEHLHLGRVQVLAPSFLR